MPRLRLGPITPLGELLTTPPTPGSYIPADEDDLGDYDEGQEADGEDKSGLG